MNSQVYIADTHALIWFMTNNPRLSNSASSIFEKAQRGEVIIVIPTICLMEVFYVCKKKGFLRIFEEIVQKLKSSLNYLVFDLNLEIVEGCLHLGVDEMHDRIIVATAKSCKATLITNDINITSSKEVPIIW